MNIVGCIFGSLPFCHGILNLIIFMNNNLLKFYKKKGVGGFAA